MDYSSMVFIQNPVISNKTIMHILTPTTYNTVNVLSFIIQPLSNMVSSLLTVFEDNV